ncbi:MAG TPA: glucose-1-phosphate cytidylyltransferase [Kofleriaceae bacterium]
MTMPVVILCGGQGTRFREQTEHKPKPMIEVCGRPILWHIMSFYAGHGYKEFVLCLGYMGDVIKRYFLDFAALSSDFTVDLSAPGKIEFHQSPLRDWKVTCVDTGADTMTGARLRRVAPYLRGDDFMVTYGDGLADVDVPALVAFHHSHGAIATVTGVRPPGRFGELVVDGTRVRMFAEKPAEGEHGMINGGFFVFKKQILDYIPPDDSVMLEREPLERAAREGELMVYHHRGFWQCMDTYRDLVKLEEEWTSGRAPWKNW